MKKKIAFAFGILAAISIIFLSAISAFFLPIVVEEEKEELVGWKKIAVKTEVEKGLIGIGDVITYKIKVLYDPNRIEIDKRLNINFEPFQIREIKEKDYKLDEEIKIYLQEYKLQLITGERNKFYSFPEIVVRYKYKDFMEWYEEKITPQSIYISARIPQDTSNLTLRPLKGKLINIGYQYFVWILFLLGGMSLILGIFLVVKKARQQRKEAKEFRKKRETLKDIFDAYQSLVQKAESEDPRFLFHHIYQLLRLLLQREEKIDWLKPNLEKISPEIKLTIFGLIKKCQKASGPEPIDSKEIKDVLELLQEILNFYLKKGGVGQ